jgi:hypothetical protein
MKDVKMTQFFQVGAFSLAPFVILTLVGISGCDADGLADGDAGPSVNDDAGAGGGNYDTFVPGLEKAGTNGQILVRLQEAIPAPPEEGENSWVIEVVGVDGAPLEEAIVTLTPWMPAHGHGTNPANYAGQGGENAGTYDIDSFVLTMPGLWELKINIAIGESISDEVIYGFMIEG